MNKCPFLSVHTTIREIKYDSEGKITEEKETPQVDLRDCLEAQCEIFDSAAGKCSLPTIDSKIQPAGSGSPASEEQLAVLKSILAETKEARENTAASQLHVLKKAEATNELLHSLKEKMSSVGGVDLGPVQDSLTELKSSLDQNQTKFTDILELILEDQQNRAAQGGLKDNLAPMLQSTSDIKEALVLNQNKFGDILELILEDQQNRAAQGGLKDNLAPMLQSTSDIKEALVLNQNKFGDILELILEDQQNRAAQGSRETELLAEISQKQERMVEALGQGLNADSLNEGLAKMMDKSGEYLKSLSEADAVRQSRLEEMEKQLIKLQQTMQELLEGQRNEQRDISNERRRQKANEHNDRGVMLFHRRELAAAEAEFRKALDIRPDFAEAYNNLGLTMSDLGKKEEAVEAFKKAIDLSPEAPEAYNNLGCLYRIRKDYQQAVELFNQAIAKREDYSLAYFNLGVAYEELEKFELAIKAWEKVLNLQPTHEEARRKLASYRARR
ncbi:MAG: tetratricopeptide repeat protein [Candidatus Edwardsbacteria bacterium]|nr:tetratricopeptide repeat protein [Candidatus Edwardsbacteria bacterium]MBU1577431.1 tetratricopeptide repeat protein [Candidatus Edwardsbacteria bacterium]MBU2463235.1 tetratricopeptide repeat protein [Candidatus Edwardsbacteria bacterium]MBU2592998.1 tetratricopeptide repeat protein [Candidatus Edwardsbacteria bacterium]